MNKYNNFFNNLILKIKNNTMLKILTATLCFAAFFSVTKVAYTVFAEDNFSFDIPKYIRVALTNGFSSKSRIDIANSDILLGYDDEDDDEFIECGEYECTNGFYFLFNDSERYVSSETYDDFDEMMEVIEDNELEGDCMPLYLGKNKFKIISKPNRDENDITDELYDNMKSIVMISGNNKEQAIFEGENNPLIKDVDEDPIKLSSAKSYRGYMKLINGTSGITCINVLPFEEYLYGVVTCEMPQSWDNEALKAQALTARSYAIKKTLAQRYSEYDLVDSTYDQVYNGVYGESESAIRAVDETKGEVIVYVGDSKNYYGKIIDAFFSSCNGGQTESSENVWSAALPYCRSKEDPYEKENKYTNWKLSFTLADLQKAMKAKGQNIGNVTGCTVTTANESDRVISFNIIGTNGTYKVTKDSIRSFFNTYTNYTCYSTNFELFSGSNPKTKEVKTDNEIYVIGEGYNQGKNKFIKDIFVLDKFNDKNIKMNSNIFVIDSSNEVTELEITKTDKVEEESEYKLNKGEYMLVGSGFGHGVGLSQYGAKDMAEEGFDYDEIIKFYYTDVDIVNVE